MHGNVVVVKRGQGKFHAKVANALAAGARSLLAVQNSEKPLSQMNGLEETSANPLPAAMLSQKDGLFLLEQLSQGEVQVASAERRGDIQAVAPNRPCAMTAESTDALWLGFLRAHFADQQLTLDVPRAPGEGPPDRPGQVHKKQRCIWGGRMLRAQVQELNEKTFVEGGSERRVTVDDGPMALRRNSVPGASPTSAGQGTCAFVDPCWCQHRDVPTGKAYFKLKELDLNGAKGHEICSAFLSSAPFHDGMPEVRRRFDPFTTAASRGYYGCKLLKAFKFSWL